ncbi:putative membrane protein [Owenweeksia hongkongensis DSM 17368]|uniref:Putative membrane protein n=1 Tax=Owenweeksia hongkongensis (strain DSM 17368 / CIP 108786 / JCM 12287 / NRRL B-23963 / UST20020801) TaxID=926562 RepID=G8R7H5_OWEHD|nr:putative sulfate exporter family transporter [Owenweeksia hongkongensis]AEV31286.1 putative membrane protein [Owenweeksia hongkongensis DSM 17368]
MGILKEITNDFTPLNWKKLVFIVLVFLCLTPWMSPAIALLLGLVVAQTIGNPIQKVNSKVSSLLLKISVVGLGFGMNINSALETGKDGVIFTVVSITLTLFLGFLLGRVFRIDLQISRLVASGTAICGGSAIAAIAPVIKADEKQISVALGIVFILNSIALLVFPSIGHYLDMTQQQFGMWAAIAIHDTSSVVGAAAQYGAEALEVATTVKLTRALWIIPVSIAFALVHGKEGGSKLKIPYFIGYFVLAMLVNTFVPGMEVISPYLVAISKAGLTLTLFLIGAGLSFNSVKSVGFKPLLVGVSLWLFISLTALWVIL